MTILTWPVRDSFEAATGIVGAGMPMDALVNPAAKARFMFGVQTSEPLVLRTPPGGGLAAGPQHSQRREGRLAHVPGLKVICPATVADAYGRYLRFHRDHVWRD